MPEKAERAEKPDGVSTTVVAHTPAREVAQTPPAMAPALVALAVAVAVILGGALVLYRRRIRDSGQHA
jgi:hypothetical protein